MSTDRSEVARMAKELTDHVMCDGFHGWLVDEDDDPNEALWASDQIGAIRTAAIVRRVFARFPGGSPPAERAARESAMGSVSGGMFAFEADDQEFFTYPDDVFKLADAYEAGE